jgi:hypothetical protein
MHAVICPIDPYSPTTHMRGSGLSLDRAEAIRKFIKSNLKIILQEKEFPEELYRRLKRQYFVEQLRSEVGRPRDPDIAHEAMMYLFKTNQIGSEDRLSEILSLPFFAKNIREKELYEQYMHIHVPGKAGTSIDLSTIAREDARQQLETEITDKMKAERLDELDRDIERVKSEKLRDIERQIEVKTKELEELQARPSILDQEDAESTPQELPQPEQRYHPWWSRLGLAGDPFPSEQGLARISKELHEKVVYKDVLLQKYISYAKNLQSELFKSTIFFGQFGSGKTTLFDYLRSVVFPSYRIHGIYVQLYGEPDVHSLRISFQNKLIDALSELYESVKGANPRASVLSPSFPPDKAIAVLIKELSGEDPGRFIVFVDDLHKNREIPVAMDFLSLLQTFETELYRRQPNLNFAFYVAGSPEWESVTRNEMARLSGSFSRRELMPHLTPDAAEEMLNRRFEAFSPDPDNPPTVQRYMVSQVYRFLQNNQLPITYRQFINTVVEQFKNGNFEDWFNIFQIPEEQLTKIRSMIEASPKLKSSFQSLLDECTKMKPEIRQMCIQAIVKTYVNNGMPDEGQYLIDHKSAFRHAAKSGLLERRWLDEKRTYFKWVVCDELRRKNNEIRTEFNLSLEDYLPQIYGTTVLELPTATVENEEVRQQRDFASSPTVTMRVREYLLDSSRLHETILQDQERLLKKQVNPDELVRSCRNSLVLVTKAALAAQAIDFARWSDDEVLAWWAESWYPLDEISEFLNIEKNRAKIAEQRAAYACSAYRQAYRAIFSFVRSQCDISRYLTIPMKDLTNDEIRTANEIRGLLAKLGFFDAADRITVLVEQKLRRFLFNIFRLLYGDSREARLRRLGKIARGEVLNNMDRDKEDGFATGENEFEHLNRKSYQFFLVPGKNAEQIAHQNWSEVFQAVFSSMSEVDVRDFLEKFTMFDKRTGHGKEESIGPEQQSFVSHYVQRAVEMLVRLNRTYLRLLQPSVKVINVGGVDKETVYSSLYEGQNPDEFYFSFCRLRDREFLEPIVVDSDTTKRLCELLCGKKRIEVDLENWRTIEEYYGVPYRVLFAFLSSCINPAMRDIVKCKMKLTVLQTRGCRVSLLAERITAIRTKDGEKKQLTDNQLKDYLEKQ